MGAVFRKHPTQEQPVPAAQVSTAHPAQGFNPRALSVDCLCWCRADAGITLNGSTVSGWGDVSGEGNDFSQATAAEQPRLRSGGLGGRPELSFDGSDDSIEGPDLYASFSSADEWTIVVVSGEGWTPGSDKGPQYYAGRPALWTAWPASWPTAAPAGAGLTAGDQPRVGFYNGSSYQQSTGPSTVSPGDALLWTSVNDSGALTLRVNGTAGSTAAAAGSLQSSAKEMTIGPGSSLVAAVWSYWDAGISEVILFDGVLEDHEIAALENYLMTRYGIH